MKQSFARKNSDSDDSSSDDMSDSSSDDMSDSSSDNEDETLIPVQQVLKHAQKALLNNDLRKVVGLLRMVAVRTNETEDVVRHVQRMLPPGEFRQFKLLLDTVKSLTDENDKGIFGVTAVVNDSSYPKPMEVHDLLPWRPPYVVGADREKFEIMDNFIYPIVFPRALKAEQNILLYGPPGTGKTQIAKATTRLFSDLLKDQGATVRMYLASGAQWKNKYVGETEKLIRHYYDFAQEESSAEHDRSLIFIDEIDALGGERSDDAVGNTPVTSLLQVLDRRADVPARADHGGHQLALEAGHGHLAALHHARVRRRARLRGALPADPVDAPEVFLETLAKVQRARCQTRLVPEQPNVQVHGRNRQGVRPKRTEAARK